MPRSDIVFMECHLVDSKSKIHVQELLKFCDL